MISKENESYGDMMIMVTAIPDQYETVRAFYHSMIDAMAGSTVYVGWKKDIYPAPEFLRESILKEELYLVLEDEQIVAAMVFNHDCNESYRKFEWQTAADDSEIMVIHALGVHPHFSGKGYAKALVQKAIDLATESGMKAIRLDVLEGNLPAESLYLGFGFQYMATLEMYYEDTGWTNFNLYEYVIPEKKMHDPTSKYIIRPYKPGEEHYVAGAHERIYHNCFGWGDNFSRYAKKVVYDFADAPRREHAEMWIAEAEGKPVGSIMLQETEEGVGQLRLFLLEPEYQHGGIGIALWRTAMDTAKAWGLKHLFLETAEPCTDARRIYAKEGFVISDRSLASDWTLDGSPVYEERWDLDL